MEEEDEDKIKISDDVNIELDIIDMNMGNTGVKMQNVPMI